MTFFRKNLQHSKYPKIAANIRTSEQIIGYFQGCKIFKNPSQSLICFSYIHTIVSNMICNPFQISCIMKQYNVNWKRCFNAICDSIIYFNQYLSKFFYVILRKKVNFYAILCKKVNFYAILHKRLNFYSIIDLFI